MIEESSVEEEQDAEDEEALFAVLERRAIGRRVRFVAENFGRTPAIIKAVQWKLHPRATLPPHPQFGTDTKVFQVLHPGAHKTPTKAPPLTYRFDWSEPHVVYGRITYEDVFHVVHTSAFLYLIETSPAGTQHLPLDGFAEYLSWD